jgi:hypothetical protein
MEKQTITFDELLDLFDTAYAVDFGDRLVFVSLEECDEGTYEIYCEDETFIISREENETIERLTYTYMIKINTGWDEEPREFGVKFLKLM